jgi:alkylation response protein AidB-like acyl-CoA dehydrogenase
MKTEIPLPAPERHDDRAFLAETTRRFLQAEAPLTRVRELVDDPDGFDHAAWSQGAELGWFGLLVPQEHGGGSVSGEGVSDLAAIVEELGRMVFPGPVVPVNLVAAAVASRGSAAQRGELLPSIVAGQTIATWAFAERNDGWDSERVALEATRDGDAYRLTGTKTTVQDAHAAHVLLVTARTDGGLTQFLVPRAAAGVTIEPLQSLDLARRFADVHLHRVVVPVSSVVGEVDAAIDDVDGLVNLAIALQCAESVGAADRTFELTLEYAQTRKAFGRPIGGFQAIKHRFADMVGWLESAKAATAAAVQAVQHDVDAAEMTSIAKSYVGTSTPRIARDCLQVHGGIGYTWEHDLHLYLRRLESNRALYGSPEQHLDRLGGIIGL